ncbi:MAG: methyltransferase domain-containing protein [Phycisphaeraceae bacterium]|nr:methyltransferase domain-containing protein [Phycisphaeraceae bacterium]
MCQAHAAALSSYSSEGFANTFLGWLNGGAMMLMTSIGHRTGLFDALDGMEPATAATIAQRAGLSERYVREWLGAMVTGGVVHYNPERGVYHLPPEHAALLTRRATPNNLAVTSQWLSVLGGVEDEVVRAFAHGKGVPYSAYGRFHEVMAEESSQTVTAGLEAHILPLVPGLVEKLERGIDVVDIACGMGLAILHLAQRFPRSRFTGVDVSDEAISAGVRRIESLALTNVRLVKADLATYAPEAAYDLVLAFDAIHDQARPDAVLGNVRRMLRTGGLYLMQDIKARTPLEENMNAPLAPFTYTISCMHCMSVSLANGGPGLGAAWGRELALKMLGDAGFNDVRVEELPHDMMNYYYIAPRG